MLLRKLLLEASPSEQAAQLGLTHVGFGWYQDSSGQVVARSLKGHLVKIRPGDEMNTTDQESDALHTPHEEAAKQFSPEFVENHPAFKQLHPAEKVVYLDFKNPDDTRIFQEAKVGGYAGRRSTEISKQTFKQATAFQTQWAKQLPTANQDELYSIGMQWAGDVGYQTPQRHRLNNEITQACEDYPPPPVEALFGIFRGMPVREHRVEKFFQGLNSEEEVLCDPSSFSFDGALASAFANNMGNIGVVPILMHIMPVQGKVNGLVVKSVTPAAYENEQEIVRPGNSKMKVIGVTKYIAKNFQGKPEYFVKVDLEDRGYVQPAMTENVEEADPKAILNYYMNLPMRKKAT
jgi:hypothetical protein